MPPPHKQRQMLQYQNHLSPQKEISLQQRGLAFHPHSLPDLIIKSLSPTLRRQLGWNGLPLRMRHRQTQKSLEKLSLTTMLAPQYLLGV
jgi:hypothetical protein